VQFASHLQALGEILMLSPLTFGGINYSADIAKIYLMQLNTKLRHLPKS
jgi:hypothetical protein